MVQSCPTIWLFKSDVSTYNEVEDSYTDLDGVHFNFSHYSTRNDKNGFQRQFKIYKADSEQMDDRLNKLAKTPKGRQRQMLTSSRNRHFLPISFLQILLDKIRHLFLIKNSLPMFHSITFIVHLNKLYPMEKAIQNSCCDSFIA